MTVISKLEITESDIRRFYSKIKIEDNGCQIWTDTISESGYGQINISNQGCSAHRLAYFISRGFIIDELNVLHNCPDGDNPACVNPHHLWQGTQSENIKDMYDKGRGVVHHGEEHVSHKLTTEEVLEIRALKGEYSQSYIADMYYISRKTVSYIHNNKSWKHV